MEHRLEQNHDERSVKGVVIWENAGMPGFGWELDILACPVKNRS